MSASTLHRLRHYVYHVLENSDHDSRLGRWIEYFLIVLIVANVLAVILESVNDIYYPYQMYFKAFERFSIMVFSVEYLLRFWSVAEQNLRLSSWRKRWQWVKSPGALIDLIAIAPAFMTFVTFDLRFLRILRLFRLMKLTRYFASMRILLVVLGKEKGSLQAVVFILLIMIVIASSGIYWAENQIQPEEFESIPQAMWWAVVTLTTVGYGDVTPMTTAGKVLGAVITILGVGLAALPAGILASGLASELEQRREDMGENFRKQLLDSEEDLIQNRLYIDGIRKELGISKEQAGEIVLQVIREKALSAREVAIQDRCFCPHCGERLD